MEHKLAIACKGRCIITDDLGNVILDKTNAVHEMNLSRIFARALSNESNFHIKSIAFGNGGTYTDIAANEVFNKPNILNIHSGLHNEVYREIIDESSPKMSSGQGSSPQDDPLATPNALSSPGVVSVEMDGYSKVVLTCVLNKNEPSGQYLSSVIGNEPTDKSFAFDEIGLFTDGIEANIPTSGYQNIKINTTDITLDTQLKPNTNYTIRLKIDDNILYQTIQLNFSSTVSFQTLIDELNNSNIGCSFAMTYPSSLYGYLKITSNTVGGTSRVQVAEDYTTANWLFNHIPLYNGIEAPIKGSDVGADNDADNPQNECSRMLTHLIFSRIMKPNDRAYVVRYILDLNVRQE